jgi:hypothetical protein
MARTGPQRYPGASTAYWYQDDFPGSPMEVNVVVLHTTEGTSLPSYGGGGSAPNLTARPDFAAQRLVWYQHFDIDTSSRALRNAAGGVETNTLNVCQVELVGTCDPATHQRWQAAGQQHIYWPEAPDWALRDLAAFLRWMHAEHGVPLTGPARWSAYPGSFGTAGGQRMSGAQWNDFAGVCGHMHVPENDHGDPGAIDFPKLIALAKGIPTPAPEDDMPTADEIASAVVAKLPRATWQTDGLITNVNPGTRGDNPSLSPAQALANTEAVARRTDQNVTALRTQVSGLQTANDRLAQAVAALAAGVGDLDPAAIVTELRTALESITVRLDVPDA